MSGQTSANPVCLLQETDVSLQIVAPLVSGCHCICLKAEFASLVHFVQADLRLSVCWLQETDAVTAAIKELGQQFPSLLEPLIFERDLFMVHRLRTVPK